MPVLAKMLAKADAIERLNDLASSDDELFYKECLEISEALGDAKQEINEPGTATYDPEICEDEANMHNCLVCLQR